MRARSIRKMTAVMWVPVTALAACLSERSEPAGPEVSNDSVVEVRLTNFAFTPANVQIRPGTLVRWINTTPTFHTVTPDRHMQWQRWATSSQADTLEHVFATAGDYPYFCEPHRSIGMTGRVVVR